MNRTGFRPLVATALLGEIPGANPFRTLQCQLGPCAVLKDPVEPGQRNPVAPGIQLGENLTSTQRHGACTKHREHRIDRSGGYARQTRTRPTRFRIHVS